VVHQQGTNCRGDVNRAYGCRRGDSCLELCAYQKLFDQVVRLRACLLIVVTSSSFLSSDTLSHRLSKV